MARKLVAGLPFNDRGETLLDANIKYGGLVYTPIGGKEEKEDGGDPIRALKREAWEEYRLIIEAVEFMGTYPTTSKGEGEFQVQTYHCKIVDGSGAEWRDGRPVPQEPDKSAFADWFSLKDMKALQKHGLLAPNLADLVSIHEDNFRVFGLGDIREEIPNGTTLLDLRAFIRKEMDRCVAELDLSTFSAEIQVPCLRNFIAHQKRLTRKSGSFSVPQSFLLANETIETARLFFELCRAVASVKG